MGTPVRRQSRPVTLFRLNDGLFYSGVHSTLRSEKETRFQTVLSDIQGVLALVLLLPELPGTLELSWP